MSFSSDSFIKAHEDLRRNVSLNVNPSINYLKELTDIFNAHFADKGYKSQPPVNVTAKLDPTVRFIGAPISVLKPYLMDENVPYPGIMMVQNCIRTRNLPTLFDLDIYPKFGSFFTGMCVLAPYERLMELCEEACELLCDRLGQQDSDRICVNISKQDKDLVRAISGFIPRKNINFDTKPAQYYRHKYGIEDAWGRNFNFALKNVRTGEFEDIGNIIIIETNNKKLGVELALGDTTIMRQLLGLDHVLDNYDLPRFTDIGHDTLRRKLEDTMMTCIVSMAEGLRPNGSDTRARILRSYLKALNVYRRLCGISLDELAVILDIIEREKLPIEYSDTSKIIVGYLKKYDTLLSLKTLSKEDIKIGQILKSEPSS